MPRRARGRTRHARRQPLGRECGCAERDRRRSIDHELQIDVVVGELHEVDLVKHVGELAREIGRILGADAKGDNRPGIAQDCASHVRLQLVHVLVRHRKSETVLAQFRKHVRHSECGKTLELVHVYEEVAAPRKIDIGPAVAGKPDRRDQEPAE
jgi:hypothetical protein